MAHFWKMNYKNEHESFVSNLTGSTFCSLTLHILHITVNILFIKLIQGDKPNIFSDLFLFVYPTILSLTIFHNQIEYLIVGFLLASVIIASYQKRRSYTVDYTPPSSPSSSLSSSVTLNQNESSARSISPSRVSIISLFKGANMLLTCISILGIDFQVFPRKFGKTEYYGLSLMDIGAGSFVICSALTSNYARKSTSSSSPIVKTMTTTPTTLIQKFLMVWQKLAVLLLGVGRLIAVKSLNYQEHTSEYGTHWNFFVTLFFIWLITDCIHICCVFLKWNEHYVLPMISVLCLLCYQSALISTPLTDYIFNSPRISFLSHNREGIFSLFGYVPLYLLTEWYSHFTFFHNISSSSSPSFTTTTTAPPLMTPTEGFSTYESSASSSSLRWSWMDFLRTLTSQSQFYSLGGGCFFTFCCYQLSSLIQPPSRRLMNISFISLVLFISLLNLFFLFLIDYYFRDHHPSPSPASSSSSLLLSPRTLYLWNKHQLVLFLIANIFTGCINMIFSTIYISTEGAILIIVSYMTCLVIISWII